MKRIQAFLTIGFIFTFLLCIGLFIQSENEKKARVEAEGMLIASLKEQTRLKAEFNSKIAEREEKINYLFAQLEKEKKIKSMLISNINRKKARSDVALQDEKQIILEKIIVKSIPDVRGKVLAVDKKNNIVVINLGELSNIKLGDKLSVYRDDYHIGDIEVLQIQNYLSAGEILFEKENLKIAINDTVTLF